MPRIDPLKLLTCLSVLLAPNGGIRSANEVKRLANLMAKFSKKLVSKCIYIQILKCTETDLLGQFMAAGGWSLVHMWLADGITTKNWPLIQELLELLLCCPVDVERLKSNTAPKLVKSLSKDSSHEGVRLLATKLVEQWLKIARNDIRSGQTSSAQAATAAPQSPTAAAAASEVDDSTDEPEAPEVVDDDSQGEEIVSETVVEEDDEQETIIPDVVPESEEVSSEDPKEEDVEGAKDDLNKSDADAKKAPLLFKITRKNGKQVLAKVESPTKKNAPETEGESTATQLEDTAEEDASKDDSKNEVDVEQLDQTDSVESVQSNDDQKVKDEKSDKSKEKDRRKSDEKDRSRDKSSSKHKEHKDKDKKSSSSSSGSSHRSSSKSSSSKHNSSSSSNSSKTSKSSSSGSKSSSSSSSSKDKDKDRHNSSSSSSHSSSSKHKSSKSSSSSSSKSSSSSSSDKHREHKDKSEKSSSSSKDKEREKEKEKDGQSKVSSPSVSKLPKIPKKPRDSLDEKPDAAQKLSPIASKKASISIEMRNLDNRPKTVKTYNSHFRSHGLIEEAPPPPSRKGLKKPSSSTTTPTPVIGSTATGTVSMKRASPPHSSKEGPPEKKTREDPSDRPGAIKLIPAKRQPSLVESDMFMDALSATLKKDVKKRKRRHSGSEGGAKVPEKTTPTAATASTPDLDKSNAEPSSPERTEKSTPPASPERPESPEVTSAVPTAAAESTPAAEPAPASPEKVTVAPMSFYRDTMADADEPSEPKKETDEDGDAKVKDEQATGAEVTTDVEMKAEEIPDTPAEPDDEDDDDVIKKPKRLKSELIDDDEAEDKNNLLDAVNDDLSKKMAEVEGGLMDAPEIPVKKPPGPGCGPEGPPGVLVIHRRKGPKKQLKWKAQDDLEEIRYFELDVTERCNVTKTFTDLKHMERVDERNKYMLSRKGSAEDNMMERTAWLPLIVVDNVPPHPEGVNSQERNLQRNRERSVLQALYFNRHMIPDSPAEPDVEVYSISEPAHIPMDDVTGNPDSVNDFTSMPWPEPKSTPPHESVPFNSPFFPGSGNDFPPFGNSGNWDMPGSSPFPGMFPPGRMPQGVPPPNAGPHGPPNANPNMMRQMSIPPNMPPMVPPNMPPHPNMFPNSFGGRGPPPPPMQHMNDRDHDDSFRNGPPPPPAWLGNNNGGGDRNRGPPPHQGNFNNRNRNNNNNNWNNNRDNDRGGPRGGNYRPPWLQNNRGNPGHRGGGGRKW